MCILKTTFLSHPSPIFFNMDTSVTINVLNQKSSMCAPKALLGGSVSQFFLFRS